MPELILSPELARACSNSTDLGRISQVRSHNRREETEHRMIEFGYIE